MASSPVETLRSNNPYKQPAADHLPESQQHAIAGQLRSIDSEKQVVSSIGDDQQLQTKESMPFSSEKQLVSSEVNSGPGNAPMLVEELDPSSPEAKPLREADKEVVDSWQSRSQGESALIPMQYHESQLPRGGLMNDYKGAPPAYERIDSHSRSESDDLVTTPTSIEPDASESNHPPRPEDQTTVGKLLAWMPSAPRISTAPMQPLLQPVIIPQLDIPPRGESVPFARCYSDALASRDVSVRDFASFLDGLAVAQAPNSALQGLKMFGVGMNSLPLPIIHLTGRGISALATSSSGHSGSRARLYIERAKKEYFAPRGLRLSIIRDNELSSRLQIPLHASRLAPLTSSTLSESVCKRRLEALAPYVAPLRYDLPEQDKEIQGVHKLARKHLERQFRNQQGRTATLREDQWRCIPHPRGEVESWDQQYAAKMAEVHSLQLDLIQRPNKGGDEKSSGERREAVQELRERQKALQILIAERKMAMQNAAYGSKGVEAEMDEVNLSQRLKWIVIENLQ